MIVKNTLILLLLFFSVSASRGQEFSHRVLESANLKTDAEKSIDEQQPVPKGTPSPKKDEEIKDQGDYAGRTNKLKEMEEEIDGQRIEIIVGFVILGLLILLVVSALVVKVLYDRNNHYMMTMLPDAERKIYAAIQCFERE